MKVCGREQPLVWYVAAAYGLPAGIEAHILHYATEMRNHGFETRVVVLRPLPKQPLMVKSWRKWSVMVWVLIISHNYRNLYSPNISRCKPIVW